MSAPSVHFIAIGGSAMHNLAIALHKKGYTVSGSDDEIVDPAKSRLQQYGLLPESYGWFPDRIHEKTDAIILGMHARGDNPELGRAKELGLRIYSYPEFLYEQSKEKLRVVIGGSHGKTSITAMILHVLNHAGKECDYMVGAQLKGFDVMVKLSETAPVMIFEGDEYLTSALDPRPKFHVYRPDIALVSGIAWDHMNVFPTFENYTDQFRIFMEMVPGEGAIIYCEEDAEVKKVAEGVRGNMQKLPYGVPAHTIKDGITTLNTPCGDYDLRVFGRHNLMNIEGARLICKQLGVGDETFYSAISTFGGASNRLELVASTKQFALYRDFAHAPSKLKATIKAVKEQYPGRKLVACFELHTYSSLNQDFLGQYRDSMQEADIAIVYYSPHALELKKLPMLQPGDVKDAFGNPVPWIMTDPLTLEKALLEMELNDANLLLMSSGNFDGLKPAELAQKIIRVNG